MEVAAEAAISSAVELLGNLVIQKVIFLLGVKGQVQRLKKELDRMRPFLIEAAQKQAHDKRVIEWISEIREVAQDAEDVIEIFKLKVDAWRSRGLPERCAFFPKQVCHFNAVGNEIESILTRLTDIDKGRERYGITGLEGVDDNSTERPENVELLRRVAPRKKDEHVVGLDEHVDEVLQNSVLETTSGLSVASIVGMAGIGKSTLAKKIYNHDAVGAKFERRAWVVVSSEFTLKETIKQVALELQNSTKDEQRVQQEIKGWEDSSSDNSYVLQKLLEMLREELNGKNYFIVLDDVWVGDAWKDAHWESLKSALPIEQDKRGRLLLTSRNNDIKTYAQLVHEMKLLDTERGWELLKKKAFKENTDDKHREGFKNIGTEILKKCGGLPLAISIVGGLLVQKESKSGWQEVLSEINTILGSDESDVSKILELSYKYLRPELKSCFLCLAFFKEDATIPVKKLVHIWVAQGTIHEEGEEMTEKIARGYLGELISRNLIQVKDMAIADRVKNCHVHDLIHELSRRKAQYEIGFHRIPRKEGSSSAHSCKPRHRFVLCSEGRLTIDTQQDKHLRSLFLVNVDGSSNGFDIGTRSCWKSLEVLRILDIQGIGLPRLPDAFRGLIGLKYLRLRKAQLSELPSWLDRLRNLEVLDIASESVRLPNDKWKIDSLRHFYVNRIDGPMRLGTWKNLETLKYFNAESWIATKEMGMESCRLRKLAIRLGPGASLRSLKTSLEKLGNLVKLELVWDSTNQAEVLAIPLLEHLSKLKLCGPITRFPDISMFPQNLSHLTLIGTQMYEDPLQVLGKLKKLVYLKLHDAYDGDTMTVLSDGFPVLEVLSLQFIYDLLSIDMEEAGMPELQRLEISNCPLLEIGNLPERIRSAAFILDDYDN